MQSKKTVFFLLLMIVVMGLGTFVKNKFFNNEVKIKSTIVSPVNEFEDTIKEGIIVIKKGAVIAEGTVIG